MKNNDISKEITLLDAQILTSVLVLISIIASIIVTYDDEQEKKGKPRLFSKNFDKYLNLFNRIYAFLIILFITYISYESYQLGKQEGKPLKPLKHQLWASILSILPAIIVILVVFETWDDGSIASGENPEI